MKKNSQLRINSILVSLSSLLLASSIDLSSAFIGDSQSALAASKDSKDSKDKDSKESSDDKKEKKEKKEKEKKEKKDKKESSSDDKGSDDKSSSDKVSKVDSKEKSSKDKSSKEKSSKKGAANQVDPDGIDASVRPYINRGLWPEAIQKLEALTASDSTAGRNEAWLAFCYLYTGNKDKVAELDKKVKAMSVDDKDKNAPALVNAFALTVQGKLDDAEKVLSGLSGGESGDALLEFARACVALKKGNAAQAAEYCEKVVGLCPNFAWGYRTLGFIQEKSLKNPTLAERAYEKSLVAEPNSSQVRGLLIDLRLAKNDFDGAIATAQEAIKMYPKDAGNYYRLSQIYQQQWRLIEALAQLQKAVALTSDDPRFFRAMASIYRHQGKMQEAIAEQQKAVELSKKDKDFELVELANLQELNQNLPEAITSLQSALKESASNSIAHQRLVQLLKKQGRNDDLIAEYKRVVDLQPKNGAIRLSLAEAYRQAGKIDEAIEQLKEAANLEQKDPRPHRAIAKIELEKKNYSAAAKSYIRALNINPASVDDLVALGFCYANNNDYMQAETAFTTGIALQQLGQSTGAQSSVNPNDIMRSLASVFFTEGRYRESVVTLEAVVVAEKDGDQKKQDQFVYSEGKALRDRNAESLKELQTSFAALDHASQVNNLDEMVDTLFKLGKKDIAIEEMKKLPEAELKEKCPLTVASVWLAQDRTKEARELINSVIEKTKDDNETVATAYVNLAHTYQKEGDKKSAIESLQKAAELNPKDFQALVELGRANLNEKKTSESQQAAQKALEVNPYCVAAYILLGETFASMDKLKDAETNYMKAAELYPTSMEAHKGLLSIFQKQSKTTEAQREQEIITNLSKNG